MSENALIIGLGEFQVMKNSHAILTCLGLGSCIAMCAYDAVVRVGGMAHFVLPTSSGARGINPGAKYVDTGIPRLLSEMLAMGALKSRIVVKVAGGATMLAVPGLNGRLHIGEDNIGAVNAVLAKNGIVRFGSDLGGSSGRQVQMFLESGKVLVKAIGKDSREL